MQFIYEPPWIAVAILVLAGVALFVYGNNRLDNKLKLLGGVIAFLGVLLGVTGHFLQSERERVDATMRDLLNAIEKRDWPRLQSHLDDDVTVFALHGPEVVAGSAKRAAEGMELKSLSLVSSKTDVSDDIATVTIQVASDGKWGQTVTNWALKFEKSPADRRWRLYEIDPLGGPGIGPNDMGSWVRGR
jgi:hypothetical protein